MGKVPGARKLGSVCKLAKEGLLLFCTQVVRGDRKKQLKQIHFHEKLPFQRISALLWNFQAVPVKVTFILKRQTIAIFRYYEAIIEEFFSYYITLHSIQNIAFIVFLNGNRHFLNV